MHPGSGFSGMLSLSALKITAGLISGSLAVVADGVDSSTDIITSVITLITARILTKPPDKKYPYGYDKADTIATKALVIYHFFRRSTVIHNHSSESSLQGGNTEAPITHWPFMLPLFQ